ncbi:MAG: sulfatase-like hydrolase/transferase [Planctomycetota bacterium]
MNAICLIVDRLHAGYLGAYGNAWVETPAIDRLASQSLVFDQHLIDSPQLDRLYRSYWHGLHAMCDRAVPAERLSLPALVRTAGVATTLLTDEPQVARHPLAADFDALVELDPAWQPQVAAAIEETHLARCFVEILEWLPTARPPFLLWTHLTGLGGTWDAPLDFRRAYQEAGDPDPPESAEVPDRTLAEKFDPDELLGISHAYAGQVSLFDSCLGAMLDAFADGPLAADTVLVVASSRGFPLGEHGRVGTCDDALYGELVHVPLLVRMPDGAAAALRSPSLVEPSDLWATLLEIWNVAAPPVPTALSLLPELRESALLSRDRLCTTVPGRQRSIRTPAWYLREEKRLELFAKPDDRFEVNDVSNRCLEVAECLRDATVEFEQTVQHGQAADLPALSDVLREGLE